MILAIDAGNSRIKWGLHDSRSGWIAGGHARGARELVSEWSNLTRPEQVIAVSVASDLVREELNASVARWNSPIRWVSSTDSACGVRNSYSKPQQLGVDRWAALIGAHHLPALRGNACLVVTAGTALTIDALSADGIFLGGIIVPGHVLMQQALAANTAALALQQGTFRPFPLNTGDAITSGALRAMAGAVHGMASDASALWRKPPVCVLSGGDAATLRPHLNLAVKLVDNLVLEGLLILARTMAPL